MRRPEAVRKGRGRRRGSAPLRRRKAKEFYLLRTRKGSPEAFLDVLPPDEAEALRPWRGCGAALLAIAAAAAAGWLVARALP